MRAIRILFFLFLAGLIASCGTVATPVWEAEPTEISVQPTATLYIPPTATPVPPSATAIPPTDVPTEAPTTAPTEAAQPATEAASPTTVDLGGVDPLTLTGNEALPAQPNAEVDLPSTDEQSQLEVFVSLSDAANGERIFNLSYDDVNYACSTCHSIVPDVRGIGPSLWGISERAGQRVEGLNAVAYIENSILHPLAYIVTGWTPQIAIMPQNYGQILTEQEITDVIAYLMTLHD